MRIGFQRLSIVILILVSVAMMMMAGCDKGKLKTNNPPSIQITSYEGSDSLSSSIPQQSFQARIFWNAMDTDGVVKGFAFRVLDLNGNPIATPGYEFIDETGEYTPDEVKAISPKYGWVLHYKPGADQSVPLDSVSAKKTIWTTQKYAVINFPASDSLGNPIPKISKFELICIDNRNAVSNVAVKYFNATSAKPDITLSTSKGNPNGGVVGTGLKLNFGIIDTDPFLTDQATHYEFAIYDSNLTTHEVRLRTPNWISTAGLAKINEFALYKTNHVPATPGNLLIPDFNSSGVQITQTIIKARGYDLAGIVSDIKTIRFAVKEGFRPQTLLYHQRILALGDNHYIDYLDDSTPEVLPSVYTTSGYHYATPFFKDRQGRFTAVYSQNLKVTLRWGWHGEYGTTSSAGVPSTTDNPYDRKQDNVLDSLDTNYYSEVIGFDLRLDNEQYNFPPLIPQRIHTDPDGKKWLRVYVTDPIAQVLVLTNLGQGKHVFEVRAIDLQDEYDRTPAVFTFYLIPPVSAMNRHDVLIVDDDPSNNTFCPDAFVDSLYNMYVSPSLSHYSISSSQLDRESIPAWNESIVVSADIRQRKLAYSDLQNYKLVIFHTDGGYLSSELDKENDGLSLYLRYGGNMVISGGQNLQPINQVFVQKNLDMLTRYFGLERSLTAITALQSGNNFGIPGGKPWFIKGVSLINPPYSDVNVELTNPIYHQIATLLHGLAPVSYITGKSPSAAYMFGFGCKNYGTASYTPTQAQYEAITGKPVGIKNFTSNNKCYLFTFPLAHMNATDTQNLFTKIFADIYGAK
ncbi:MAG TPA: hypothetical protein PLE74_03470 [Candidatus Cloacimonadota bacterium]|nr:hypothetical protein [Candidatus Cloacimonadota bacterium]HPT71320.1 hypothetical protein [Candidatus Cloacimonadota bacterium]